MNVLDNNSAHSHLVNALGVVAGAITPAIPIHEYKDEKTPLREAVESLQDDLEILLNLTGEGYEACLERILNLCTKALNPNGFGGDPDLYIPVKGESKVLNVLIDTQDFAEALLDDYMFRNS